MGNPFFGNLFLADRAVELNQLNQATNPTQPNQQRHRRSVI